MKQYYYTSCLPGRSVNKRDGYQVRAVTPGISPERLAKVGQATGGYEIPGELLARSGPAEAQGTARGLPRDPEAYYRLAYVRLEDGTRILSHTLPLARDASTGQRMGNYFLHALIDLPPQIDADRAVRCWGGSFWRRVDGDFDVDLPEAAVEELPDAAPELDRRLLETLQSSPERQEVFADLLNAVLVLPPEGSAFIVEPAYQVAAFVRGIARALPRPLRLALTFTTHESSPLLNRARVTGAWRGGRDARVLPSSCFDSPDYWAIEGDRCSEPLKRSPYVSYAVKALASGRGEILDRFVRLCDELDVGDPQELEEVFRLGVQGASPSLEGISTRLDRPRFLRWYVQLDQERALKQVIDKALSEPGSVEALFAPVAAAMRDDPEALRALDQRLWKVAHRRIVSNDVEGVRAIFERLFPHVFPGDPGYPWQRLLDEPPPREERKGLSVAMRSFLLSGLAPCASPQEGRISPAPALDAWLEIPAEQVAEVLTAELPPWLRLRGGLVILRTQKVVPAGLARALSPDSKGWKIALNLLGQAHADGSPEVTERAACLFGLVLEASRSWKILEMLFEAAAKARPAVVDRALAVVIEVLARRDLEGTMKGLAALPGPGLGGDIEPFADAGAVLRNLARHAGRLEGREQEDSLAGALARWCWLARYPARPRLDTESLDYLACLLKEISAPTRQTLIDRMLPILVTHLAERQQRADALERLVGGIGPLHPGGPEGVYRAIWQRCRDRHGEQLFRQRTLATDLVAVGLGARPDWPQGAEMRSRLYPEVSQLIGEIRRHTPGFVSDVDESCRQRWSPGALEIWDSLTAVPVARRVGFLGRLLAAFGLGGGRANGER